MLHPSLLHMRTYESLYLNLSNAMSQMIHMSGCACVWTCVYAEIGRYMYVCVHKEI